MSEIKTGLIGYPLGHSASKEIHSLMGDHGYELKEIGPDELDTFMKYCPFDGFNVTIPYKKDVIPYMSELSDEAKATGAVNTVIKKDGAFLGFNTDVYGFEKLLDYNGIDVEERRVLVLGTGGASAAAAYVCSERGAKTDFVSRTGVINYSNVYEKCGDTEIIINATPVGMYPKNGAAPVDITKFRRVQSVVDLIYNPFETRLLFDARMAGIEAVNGLEMLVFQASKAHSLFFGEEEDFNIGKIVRTVAESRKNYILIGMPGVGKSTYGGLLAAEKNRPFYDTDEVIEEREKMNVAEIFVQKGEKYFRDAETEVLRELTKQSGLVIASGGGSVLREENRRLIKQNAHVIFIRKDISKLDTKGRPLSQNCDLNEMYKQRLPLYLETADEVIEL